MPTHKKRRRPKVEQEKLAKPFFSSGKDKETAFFNTTAGNGRHKKLEILKNHTISLLQGLKEAINNSSPEEGGIIQEKTLQLANLILATEVHHIDFLNASIERLCQRIKAGISYDMSEDFYQSSPSEQQRKFLELSIKSTSMPELIGQASSEIQYEQPEKAWADFILKLLYYLPMKPLVHTGTIIHRRFEREEDPGILGRMVRGILQIFNN